MFGIHVLLYVTLMKMVCLEAIESMEDFINTSELTQLVIQEYFWGGNQVYFGVFLCSMHLRLSCLVGPTSLLLGTADLCNRSTWQVT